MNLEDYVPGNKYETRADGETFLLELSNPITRYQVRLDPPCPVTEDLAELYQAFGDFCDQAWDAGPVLDEATGYKLRLNPAVVDPYRVIDGTQTMPDLQQLAADLVQCFGYLAAHHAIDEHDPVRQAAMAEGVTPVSPIVSPGGGM